MKIAVAYENGRVFQHFGHSQQFKIYTVENGEITASRDTLICGGIGGGAQQVLAAAGIRLFGGVSGNADAAVMELIGGTLNFDPNVRCSHHDREHDGEVHRCGEHGCGEHHCEGSCGH